MQFRQLNGNVVDQSLPFVVSLNAPISHARNSYLGPNNNNRCNL